MVPAVSAVGVDNGGTWIRLKGLDAKGRVVWSLRKPSPTVDKLPLFLKQHLKHFRDSLTYLAVGSRGVWKQAKRARLKHDLFGLAQKIVVMSDVEAAWMAAFSPHPRFAHPLPRHRGRGPKAVNEGIIVISGTGSIAYGQTSNGKHARAGGLGPDKGDEGSGYWIGKRWLHSKFPSPPQGERAWPQRPQGEGASAVRRTAAFAPLVIRKARNGDPIAGTIIREAQSHLAELVGDIIKTLKWKRDVPLSVNGSVLENDWFRSTFLNLLRQKDIQFQFVKKKTDQTIAPLRSIMIHVSRRISHLTAR